MKITKPVIRMNIQLLANDNKDEKTVEEQLLELQEKLENMNKVIEENEKLKKQNEMLFNKNQEYFLKITGNISSKEEDETNEYEEFVGADFYNKLSNKEQKMLKTILEGEDE